VRLSAIGDVTHIVPIVRNLQRNWPKTTITWIIGAGEYTLLADIEGVEFIVFDKNKGLASYRTLYNKLKKRHFDVLLHMQVSLRASLVSLTVRAPIRIGFDKNRAKNGQWLFTNHRIIGESHQHVLDGFLSFIKLLGIKSPSVEWDIPIPEIAKQKVDVLINDNRPIMAINPSTSNRARNWRNWDAQAYAKIAEYASERYNFQTVLTGGTAIEEKTFAETISANCKIKILNLVGKTNLKELLALLDQATLVISPDTGPAHMANAVGTPTIGLYASSNPDRTGPYSFRNLTIDYYPEAVQKQFGKTVENISWGKRVRDPLVMSLIQIEDVKKRIDQVLSPIYP